MRRCVSVRYCLTKRGGAEGALGLITLDHKAVMPSMDRLTWYAIGL